ncbi:MAG: PD-(D/E)XK nuclease family protein [Myxococcales bacterium]|nr:PD-(D/E)XK nuclease family protein [Myxococcales bacterium]
MVDNDDLLALESRMGRFNVFDALNIARAEVRHSNFLAFILDPGESHGQGSLFLRAILMDLLKLAQPHLRPLSPIEIDGTELRGVEVRREWKHIDLLITCREPAFVVAVENKVDSHEHSNQLARYRSIVLEQFPSAPTMFIFLSPGAEPPSDGAWVHYGYADIHRVLTRVRAAYENSIGDDVLVFLDHYLSLIGARFMDDSKIDELCRRIYKNHRRALQLIFERAGSPSAGILGEVEALLHEEGRWHVFHRAARYIDFVPQNWLAWLPHLASEPVDDPRYWIGLRLEVEEGSLDFYAEVGRMKDLELRRRIIEALLTNGAALGFERKGNAPIRDKFTRVTSREHLLRWNDDDEPDVDVIRRAAKKRLDRLHAELSGVRALVLPLIELGNQGTP